MLRIYIFLVLTMLVYSANAQRRFIKTNTIPGFGSSIRIIATNDQGWIIISMDSLRICKFDKCGKIVWSKKYFIANEIPSLTDIITLHSGDFLLLTRIFSGTSNFCLVTRFDSAGVSLWSKSY